MAESQATNPTSEPDLLACWQQVLDCKCNASKADGARNVATRSARSVMRSLEGARHAVVLARSKCSARSTNSRQKIAPASCPARPRCSAATSDL